jgi:hypothetical protein
MSRRLLTGFLAATVLAAGCATQSPTAEQLVPVPSAQVLATPVAGATPARVTVIRDVGIVGAGVFFHVYLDGVRIASLGQGQWHTFNVEPGEHQIGVMPTDLLGTHRPKTVETLWRPGQSVVYRVGGAENLSFYIARDPRATAPGD